MVYLWADSIYEYILYGLSMGWLYIWIYTLWFIYGLTLYMNIYSMVYLWVDDPGEFSDKNHDVSPRGYITILYYDVSPRGYITIPDIC